MMEGQIPRLIDREALRSRQARAARLGPATFLLDRVAEDMHERLGAVLRDFKDVVDVWTPGDIFQEAQPKPFDALHRIGMFDAADEALRLAPASLDLVVSALALQFANDLPGVFAQIRRALRPDGLFLAALLGGE